MTTVKNMRMEFDHLIQGHDLMTSDSTLLHPDLTPGQMLLMGFNGLFTQLGADFDAMLDAIGHIQAPDTWKMIDVVKEAQSIQVYD